MGTQPGFLANRKVTSPLTFYTPFEPTPVEAPGVDFGEVGEQRGGGDAILGDERSQTAQQLGIAEVGQGVGAHDAGPVPGAVLIRGPTVGAHLL